MRMIRLALPLLLAACLLLSACTRTPAPKPEPVDSVKFEQGGSDMNTDNSASMPDPTEYPPVWQKDIVINDAWTPGTALSDAVPIPAEIDASEAQPVRIGLSAVEVTDENMASSEGGLEADYCTAAIADGTDAASVPGLVQALDEWNRYAKETASTELAQAHSRYSAYRQQGADGFLYLTSWISMQIGRADTQVLSYIRERYRYNREQEPNYYEFHGVTVDAVTGEKLSLNDFIGDTDLLLTQLEIAAWAQLHYGYRDQADELIGLMKEAVLGCRDDGSFAWMVLPSGLEFRIAALDPNGVDHYSFSIFVPFTALKKGLRPERTALSYDYLDELPKNECLPQLLGSEGPQPEGDEYFGNYFYGSIHGQNYLYAVSDEATSVYALGPTGAPEKVARIPGSLFHPAENYCYTTLDPEHVELTAMVQLGQELFLEGFCRIGEDGIPEPAGLFTLSSNPLPMTTAMDFEAEIFPDEDSTEAQKGIVPAYSMLWIFRTDGETFIDCTFEGGICRGICRIYVEGSWEEGWLFNGLPKEEVIGYEGYYER